MIKRFIYVAAASLVGLLSLSPMGMAEGESQPRALNGAVGRSLAVIKYRGGFNEHLQVAMTSVQLVKAFKIDVPEFCDAVIVKEAGAIIDNTPNNAEEVGVRSLKDKNLFNLNKGAGVSTYVIWVSLNGPINMQCDIPILAADPDNVVVGPLPTTSIDGHFFDAVASKDLIVRNGKIIFVTYNFLSQSGRYRGSMVFPNVLTKSQTDENTYATRGIITNPMDTNNGGAISCQTQFEAQLAYSEEGKTLEVKLRMPANVTLMLDGRCVYSADIDETVWNMTRS